MNRNSVIKAYELIAVIIVWFALVLQFEISLKLLSGNYFETLKIYFSFFTITTNIIVAICLTSLLFFRNSKTGNFFAKPSTVTAITVYIVVVGLIYNILLRGLLLPTGWARVADELLHVVNPLLFLGFWILFVDKYNLDYRSALSWLIYPIVYIIFIVIRGYLIDLYPYPFINVVNLGYPTAILNAFFCLVLFWLLSILLIWIGKVTSKN